MGHPRMKMLAAIMVLACAGLFSSGQAHAQNVPCELVASIAYEEWTILPELERCAIEGDADAEAVLGMIHLGASDPVDCPDGQCPLEALEYAGFKKAMSVEALRMEGFRLLRSAAAKGNRDALNELGNASLHGEYGATVNHAEAREWLLKATAAGDEIAPFNLAQIYFGGMGVERSAKTGTQYLRLSERRGYRPARCTLIELAGREDWVSGVVAAIGGLFGAFTDGVRCHPDEILDEID